MYVTKRKKVDGAHDVSIVSLTRVATANESYGGGIWIEIDGKEHRTIHLSQADLDILVNRAARDARAGRYGTVELEIVNPKDAWGVAHARR